MLACLMPSIRQAVKVFSDRNSTIVALILMSLAPIALHTQTPQDQQPSDPMLSPRRPFSSLVGPTEPRPFKTAHRVHVIPFRPQGADANTSQFPPAQNVTPTCKNPQVSYFGGPVISNVQVVPVFWNGNVNSQLTASTTGMPQFLSDISNSTYWGVVAEYGTDGVSPSGGVGGTDQVIRSGSATQGYTLSPTVCPTTTSTLMCKLTDAQLQSELNSAIDAGILPQETFDPKGNVNTL